MKKHQPKLIVILGPTSSGKTKLAVKLAKFFNGSPRFSAAGEIVSADSRQVYKGMDIGTGKDLKEYGEIPYHLIDIASPKTQFSLAKYQKLAYRTIDDIIKRGKTPFLVGGTGLYLQSIVDGYQLSPAKPNKKLRQYLNMRTLEQLQGLANKYKIRLNQSDFHNKRRLVRAVEKAKSEIYDTRLVPSQAEGCTISDMRKAKYDCLILGLRYPKQVIALRIDKRLIHRLEKEGLTREVKKLRRQGVSWKRLEDFGLEYRFIAKYLKGELNYDEMVKKLATAIHQFAKRQMTWFKRMKKIHWMNNVIEAEKLIKKFIKN